MWVDGNDPEWKKEFDKWKGITSGDSSIKRYRDWDNLHYMFRGFEKFTPWVRKIHFVTWGHLPKWLDTTNSKINIVYHDELLNNDNLPVFNCNPLENNLHKIKDLSEKFVYFNDDMFVLRAINPERFFKNNLPRDIFVFTTILMTHLAHIRLNDLMIINKYFNKFDVLKKIFFKLFNYKYGLHLIKSLLLLPWPHITGFVDPHQPQPFLKATFTELWNKEFEILSATNRSKFRKNSDVNQYLFRYWQLIKGDFIPVSFRDALCIQIKKIKDAEIVSQQMRKDKFSLICINDLVDDDNDDLFEKVKSIVNESFERILPDKSSFEK